MVKMAWKFFVAMVRHQFAKWRGYEIFTPPAMLAYRDHSCLACEFNEEGQCRVCRCLTFSKTLLALEECPKGRWHRVWIRTSGRKRRAG